MKHNGNGDAARKFEALLEEAIQRKETEATEALIRAGIEEEEAEELVGRHGAAACSEKASRIPPGVEPESWIRRVLSGHPGEEGDGA